PDSRYLLFYDGTGTGELRKVAVAGGAPQSVVTGLPVYRGAAWNSDGTILFGAVGQIQRVSENGGTPAAVTGDRAVSPTMLPDGRHFLFLGGGRGVEEAIWAGALDSKDVRKITLANSGAQITSSGHLLFMRGVTLMAQRFDSKTLATSGDA